MIRLIVTDLDGTLLNDNKTIHPSYWEVHRSLTDKGVMFAAASGRQYYNLLEQFRCVKDEIILLAENGTFVKYRGEEILVNELPLDNARFFIEMGRKIKGTELILCGKSSAYVESNYAPFLEDASRYYKRLKIVNDLTKVEDTVLKFTLWDHNNAEDNAYPHFQSYTEDFKIAVAGQVWLDITHKTASKGTAIHKIQQLYGISPEDTLVFGDYLNDLDMMTAGYHSYAMKNAHPRILEASRFVTRFDNNHNGVVETIKKLFRAEL